MKRCIRFNTFANASYPIDEMPLHMNYASPVLLSYNIGVLKCVSVILQVDVLAPMVDNARL